MRDDLYKTVPPTSAWRRVIRLAPREYERPQAREAMAQAIRTDVLAQLDQARLDALRSAVAKSSPDFWGVSAVPAYIDAYIAQATSEHERRLGYMLHGLWERDGYRAGLVDQGIKDMCRESIHSCIEQCCAIIRKAGEGRQAAIAKRVLHQLATAIEFEPPSKKKIRPRLVDTVLPLQA